MTHFLTDDQRLIQNSVREFCQDPETQRVAAADKKKGGFPIESWRLAAEQGYVAAYVPESYGGLGYDLTTYFVILEEMTRAGNPAANSLGGHDLGVFPVLYWGSDEIKEKYLTPLGSGRSIACGAVTDPAGLTNFPQWGLTEQEEDDSLVLNANKVMVSNAHVSDIKVIFGKPTAGHFDNVYVVEAGMPGVETGFQEKKLIPGVADWGSISLKDVRIPQANKIVDNGFGQLWLGPSFLSICLTSLVLAETGFKLAMNYTTQRTKYDRPLTDLQSVSHRLMNMAIRNELSRDLIYTGTRLWDEGRYEEAYRVGCMAKAYVPEAANQTLHEAAILHGGVGFTPQAMIGVLWAASLQLEIAELPADVHRDFLAETYGIPAGWKQGRP